MAGMERLLDFSSPMDVALLEQVVQTLQTTADQNLRNQANKVLTALKEHDSAWQTAGTVLEQSNDHATRFFALTVLEDAIKFRWKALPNEQREGIRNYVVKKLIDITSNDDYTREASKRTFVNKLNLILVQILKQEWPHNWPNFIPEIVDSSTKSEVLCENNMNVLRLLSEEVFDYSKEEMISDKVKMLKEQFNSEFRRIFDLCQLVLNSSQRPSLVIVTLRTLLRFLAWIPLGYIFETDLVNQLLTKFLPNTTFRNDTLACLTEIAGLKEAKYDMIFQNMFITVMRILSQQLPLETDIPAEYDRAMEREQDFIRGLSLFFVSFFSQHLDILEQPENHSGAVQGMMYLVSISMVDDKEIFKICLEFWSKFAKELYDSDRLGGGGRTSLLNLGSNPGNFARKNIYASVLQRVRNVMISRMAKPEEVLVVEDDDGSIVRETTKDTDAIAQYKTMRDTLVYLTHLDPQNTEEIMLTKLTLQNDVTRDVFNWNDLNTLCWAIGSISGAMTVSDEKRFLVVVIKDLLQLCERKRGKDNKAVVASNIMYVVGQYPRFLEQHWRFLKTVVHKLFEFMHELHPGVQDMACDTFLKISQKCRRQFVFLHPTETQPFIEELLGTILNTTRDLSPHQRLTFYEAVGHMVKEQENEGVRNKLLAALMQPASTQWRQLMEQGSSSPQALTELTNIQRLADILRTNVRVCSSMGYTFRPQLQAIYLDMLHVYKFYGEQISQQVRESGPAIVQHKHIKVMRVVKVEILRLIETFVQDAQNNEDIANNFCPVLIEPVLLDYERGEPITRQPEVLELFTAIVNKLRTDSNLAMDGKFVHQMLGPLFNPTLELITKDFVENPEHRVNFYKLLRALARYSFEQLFSVPPETQKSVMDSIVWAFKHPDRTNSELGLEILERVLQNVANAPDTFAQPFYSKYYLSLVQDILYVLTDRLHKSSFTMHATILQMLFTAVAQGRVKEPLNPSCADNRAFLVQTVSTTISEAFPNVSRADADGFVAGMLEPKDPAQFKTHVRDFLVRLREFSGDQDLDQLYSNEREEERLRKQQQLLQERAAVPGMLTQQEKDEMADL